MEDFEWVRDVNYITYEYLNGKALLFDPVIDVISCCDYLQSILDYLVEMGFNVGFNAGDVLTQTRSLTGLYCDDGDYSRVLWTGDSTTVEDYQSHIDVCAGRSVEVINGWGIFPKDLFE
tara:strand:+ start:106 stop:462 length:357 start_codon:yes stop_codon:yes gene_type:complete